MGHDDQMLGDGKDDVLVGDSDKGDSGGVLVGDTDVEQMDDAKKVEDALGDGARDDDCDLEVGDIHEDENCENDMVHGAAASSLKL